MFVPGFWGYQKVKTDYFVAYKPVLQLLKILIGRVIYYCLKIWKDYSTVLFGV